MEIFVFLFTNLMFQNQKKNKTELKNKKKTKRKNKQTNKQNKNKTTKEIFCDYEVQHINQ